jgi:predicted porin
MKTALTAFCALAACTVAQAQTNATLYGNLDQYIGYIKSDSGKSVIGLNDGTSLRSRWGLRGTEELGNGYQARFQLEAAFNADTGTMADAATNRLFDRQAWVGLNTPIGEFRVGRQNTEILQIGDYIDYTSRTTFGSIVNNFGTASRYDNDISFKTNRVGGGFQAAVHYALAEQLGGGVAQQAVYQLWIDYLKGPFRVGFAGLGAKPAPTGSVKNKIYYNNAYVNYDYGQGKIYLVYVRSNNSTTSGSGILNGAAILNNISQPNNLFPGTDANARRYYNIYQVSADYRLTPGLRVGALYGRMADQSGGDAGTKGGNVGAYYDLSKRTTLYGFASRMQNERNAGFRFSGSAGPSAQLTSPADVNGHTLTGLQAGIIHRF